MALTLRFLAPPTSSFFLFGARGTGKSTWTGQQWPDALRPGRGPDPSLEAAACFEATVRNRQKARHCLALARSV